MDKKFITMRKKGFVYDYGLKKWVKEPIGMYGDPALVQLFRPTTGAVDLGWTCGICKSSNLESDLLCGFCDSPRPSH
jgi:hypothetical protein